MNVLRTLHGAVSPSSRTIDGVAVVSDIMASRDPFNSAKKLVDTVRHFQLLPPPVFSLDSDIAYTAEGLVKAAAGLLPIIKANNSLIHQASFNCFFKSL